MHEIEGVVLSIDWLHNKQTINTLAASADTEIEYWIKGSKDQSGFKFTHNRTSY